MPATNQHWNLFGMKRNGPTIELGVHFATNLEDLFQEMIEKNKDLSIIGFIAQHVDEGIYFRIVDGHGLGFDDELSSHIRKASLLNDLHNQNEMRLSIWDAMYDAQRKYDNGSYQDVIEMIHEIEGSTIPDHVKDRDPKSYAREKMIDLLASHENICSEIDEKRNAIEKEGGYGRA